MSKNMSKNNSKVARGIRNNNAGNIRYNARNDWLGQIGNDGAFVIFDKPEHGIRALSILLKNYNEIHGLNTVQAIISKYAPSNENNTKAYIKHVAKKLNVREDEHISVRDKLSELIAAIITHENGYNPYSTATITDGIKLSEVKKYA